MASVTLTGIVGGAPGTVTIEIENLNWVSLNAGYSIEQDALPNDFISITVATPTGSMVWWPANPNPPTWLERLLEKLSRIMRHESKCNDYSKG